MSTNEIGPIRLPEEMVTVTPVPNGLQFAYQQAPDGTELIALVVEDRRVGTVRNLLTLDAIRLTIATLSAMLDDLPTLRAQWKDTQR